MTATPKVLPAPVRADAADAVLPGLRWALARDIKLALRSRTELAHPARAAAESLPARSRVGFSSPESS